MTSLPEASGSVTAGSQLSSVPVKCCRQSNGSPAPPPNRRYAQESPFTWRNCVGAVVLLALLVDDIGLSNSLGSADHPSRDDRLELGRSLLPDTVTGLEHIQADRTS